MLVTLVSRFPTPAKMSPHLPWAQQNNQKRMSLSTLRRSLRRKMRKTKMANQRVKTRKTMKEWRRTTTPTWSGKLGQSPSADDDDDDDDGGDDDGGGDDEDDNDDYSHLIRQIGPITIDSTPPEKPTRHRDVAESMRGSVLSRCPIVDCIFLTKPLLRPGSPISWNFGVKESITVAPPRPESASLLVWVLIHRLSLFSKYNF